MAISQKASYSVIWLNEKRSSYLPRTRCRAPTRSSRASGIRPVHQMSPLVEATTTSSPFRRPVSRNVRTALRASAECSGSVLRSSTRTAKARPLVLLRGAFVATGEGAAGSTSGSDSGCAKASKLTISTGLPSSVTTKSSRVRPVTEWWFLSNTTASTVMSWTSELKTGTAGGAWGCDWGFPLAWGSAAGPLAAREATQSARTPLRKGDRRYGFMLSG